MLFNTPVFCQTINEQFENVTGNLNNNKIKFTMAVAENENNDHFEVEKSS